MLENVLYKSIIVPMRQATDGETPTVLWVTQEMNGVAIWKTSADGGWEFLKMFLTFQKNEAIEYGVKLAEQLKISSVVEI